jgi:lipoyl(octanoyl) transferase
MCDPLAFSTAMLPAAKVDVHPPCRHKSSGIACAVPCAHEAGMLALPTPEWTVAAAPVTYPDALAAMELRAAAIRDDGAPERIWLIEHPPLYTAGTSADPAELIDPRFPVFEAGRGGRYTYHGPGQRVVYAQLDLAQRGRDIRCYVHAMEGWVIATLADFGVAARRAEGRIGIWCDDKEGREAKIGAIGVRVRRWVTLHGLSINVAPDLSHFTGIVPCGIAEFPVTSLHALGIRVTMADVDAALLRNRDAFLSCLRSDRAVACDVTESLP